MIIKTRAIFLAININFYSLRAAIYQTGESDPELKELKESMVDELEKAERRLLIDYLRTVPDIEEIK